MSHFYDPDLAAELRDAGRMVARAPEPDDAPREHVWRGAFCSVCGADEAGSFADSPCPGVEDESRGHH